MNRYFDSIRPAPFHHRLSLWMEYLNESTHVEMEVRREDHIYHLGPVDILVKFEGGANSVPWRLEYDDWLIMKGVKCVSITNEKLRFALRLNSDLSELKKRYDNRIILYVLTSDLRDGPFQNHPELSAMLARVSKFQTPQLRIDAEPVYNEVVAHLDYVISRVALKIRDLYSREEAEDILAGALAQSLEDKVNPAALERALAELDACPKSKVRGA